MHPGHPATRRAQPHRLFSDPPGHCISLMEFGNRVFVAGCECEGWKPYMNFMINQRKDIAEFLIKTSKEIKRVQSYEDVMDVLEKEYE